MKKPSPTYTCTTSSLGLVKLSQVTFASGSYRVQLVTFVNKQSVCIQPSKRDSGVSDSAPRPRNSLLRCNKHLWGLKRNFMEAKKKMPNKSMWVFSCCFDTLMTIYIVLIPFCHFFRSIVKEYEDLFNAIQQQLRQCQVSYWHIHWI